jgi:hypothetical protein
MVIENVHPDTIMPLVRENKLKPEMTVAARELRFLHHFSPNLAAGWRSRFSS